MKLVLLGGSMPESQYLNLCQKIDSSEIEVEAEILCYEFVLFCIFFNFIILYILHFNFTFYE